MGFLSGLVTGASVSIDKQLQKDMQRTQERMDGMAQYRVTRRRAEQERYQKETKEVKDVLRNIAGLFGGDIDKAAQAYKLEGSNLEAGRALYSELKKNADADIDVEAAYTFAKSRTDSEGNPLTVTDYLSNFVTPISTLPVSQDEMQASGLYALFKPDVGKQMMQQVEEEAPLAKRDAADFEIGTPTIDRSTFLAAQEYQETLKQRERLESAETRAVSAEERAEAAAKRAATGFQTAEERYAAAEDRAVKAEERAAKRFASDEERLAAQEERAAAEEARKVLEAERAAQRFISQQELTGLSIEEKELAIQKAKEHPEFSTYERMSVYADTKLVQLMAVPEPERDNDAINEMKALRDYAIDGAIVYNSVTDSTTPKPTFSKQSVDSIVKGEITTAFPKDLIDIGLDGELTISIEGNEASYFNNMNLVIDNLQNRFADLDDATMNGKIQSLQNTLQTKAKEYATAQIEKGSANVVNLTTEDIGRADVINKLPVGTVAYDETSGEKVLMTSSGPIIVFSE